MPLSLAVARSMLTGPPLATPTTFRLGEASRTASVIGAACISRISSPSSASTSCCGFPAYSLMERSDGVGGIKGASISSWMNRTRCSAARCANPISNRRVGTKESPTARIFTSCQTSCISSIHHINVGNRIGRHIEHEFSALSLHLLPLLAKALWLEHRLARGACVQVPHPGLSSTQSTDHHSLVRPRQIHCEEMQRACALNSQRYGGKRPIRAALYDGAVLPFCNIGEDVIERKDHPRRRGEEFRQRRACFPFHQPQPARGFIVGERSRTALGQVLDAPRRPCCTEQRHLAWINRIGQLICSAFSLSSRRMRVIAALERDGANDHRAATGERLRALDRLRLRLQCLDY